MSTPSKTSTEKGTIEYLLNRLSNIEDKKNEVKNPISPKNPIKLNSNQVGKLLREVAQNPSKYESFFDQIKPFIESGSLKFKDEELAQKFNDAISYYDSFAYRLKQGLTIDAKLPAQVFYGGLIAATFAIAYFAENEEDKKQIATDLANALPDLRFVAPSLVNTLLTTGAAIATAGATRIQNFGSAMESVFKGINQFGNIGVGAEENSESDLPTELVSNINNALAKIAPTKGDQGMHLESAYIGDNTNVLSGSYFDQYICGGKDFGNGSYSITLKPINNVGTISSSGLAAVTDSTTGGNPTRLPFSGISYANSDAATVYAPNFNATTSRFNPFARYTDPITGQVTLVVCSTHGNNTVEVSPAPTASPTPAPTILVTFPPTPNPTTSPTGEPTPAPTPFPTILVTLPPTMSPTGEPTPSPTYQITFSPTGVPTLSPTQNPTREPTPNPTPNPTPAQIDQATQEINWTLIAEIGGPVLAAIILAGIGAYAYVHRNDRKEVQVNHDIREVRGADGEIVRQVLNERGEPEGDRFGNNNRGNNDANVVEMQQQPLPAENPGDKKEEKRQEDDGLKEKKRQKLRKNDRGSMSNVSGNMSTDDLDDNAPGRVNAHGEVLRLGDVALNYQVDDHNDSDNEQNLQSVIAPELSVAPDQNTDHLDLNGEEYERMYGLPKPNAAPEERVVELQNEEETNEYLGEDEFDREVNENAVETKDGGDSEEESPGRNPQPQASQNIIGNNKQNQQ